MNSIFEKICSGHRVHIEAEYSCEMKKRISDFDGIELECAAEPKERGVMNVFVDGVLLDSINDPAFWQLIESDRVTCRRIWGSRLAFKDPAVCAEYDAWLAALLEAGTTEAVREYRREVARKEARESLERAQEIIAACDRQRDIPTRDEARRRMRAYNEVMNEGGYGFVPYIYCDQEYAWAQKIVKEAE